MAKRFTDSRKWEDPWFLELSTTNKLIWVYVLDKCNHAGIYKHSSKMLEFFVSGSDWENFKSSCNGRIVDLENEKYFIEKFILFQQKVDSLDMLNPNNKCHLSIIKILQAENVISPLVAPNEGLGRGLGKGIGIGIGKGKGKGKKKKVENKPTDEEFLNKLKGTYDWVDIETELKKIDGWLIEHPNRKKTRRFIINWFNRIDKPLKIGRGENDPKKRWF